MKRASKRATVRGGVLVVAVGLSSGCYTYTPARVGELQPAERVRVTVSAEQAAELEDVLRTISRTFNATYLEGDRQEVLLQVPLRSGMAGASTRPVHNRVRIPSAHLVGVETRELSAWRTGAVVAVGVAALAAAASSVIGGDDKADQEPPPVIDESRIPLLSLPFRIFGW